MQDPQVQIRVLDVVAILAYLGGTLGIALFFARRNTNTEEYFVGGRSFAGWVIGLSMLGTIVSSGTFLALPAAAYALDWRQLSVNLALPFVAVLAVVVFIPLFRQGQAAVADAVLFLGRELRRTATVGGYEEDGVVAETALADGRFEYPAFPRTLGDNR